MTCLSCSNKGTERHSSTRPLGRPKPCSCVFPAGFSIAVNSSPVPLALATWGRAHGEGQLHEHLPLLGKERSSLQAGSQERR
jgi:hypothetical protein